MRIAFKKISRPVLFVPIFLVVFAWIFSGWPEIYKTETHRIPPEVSAVLAASPETFNTSGTFTTPTGIYTVTGECRGGGAGGSNNGSATARPGGGGGGGAYAKTNSIAVTPGQGYTVTVAAQVNAQTAGQNSSFTGNSSQTVVAVGGSTTTTRTGGAGGTTTASTGDVKFAGGAGGTAANTASNGGGGGGEGGGSTATGGAGQANSGATGGAGGTGSDGGDGGKGGDNTLAGADGSVPGGGGGGAGGTNDVGGKGAAGQCVISYTDTWAPSTVLGTYSPTWSFASGPANDSATQISMTATSGYDYTTPIQYQYTNDNTSCGANSGTGGAGQSWSASTTYSNSGLQVNKCYGYSVQARDSVGTPNTGTASSVVTTYTSANTPGTPTLSGATSTTLNLTNSENGNPTSNPTTNYAVTVTTTSPTDNTWINKWVDTSGNPSASAVWMSDSTLDALVLHGLTPGSTYGVKVKARNQDGDETALSAETQATTVLISITISDGSISYGMLPKGATKDTTSSGVNDSQTATNNGNVAEDFNIKGQNTTAWTLAGSQGSEQYFHKFCNNGTCDASPTWTALTTNYQAVGSNIATSGTKEFDLQIGVPSATATYTSQNADVTIQAVAH